MSAFNGAHSVRGGFNQSGGAYFVCVSALSGANGDGVVAPVSGTIGATASHLFKVSTAATKSGGAFEPAVLARVSAQEVFGTTGVTAANAANEFAAGKLIKDMGKTVVDKDGRTFRKFAVVGTGSAKYLNSFGVAGGSAGYATFYLDVGREGQTVGTSTLPAPIARYF
jgi:hypothetical protein